MMTLAEGGLTPLIRLEGALGLMFAPDDWKNSESQPFTAGESRQKTVSISHKQMAYAVSQHGLDTQGGMTKNSPFCVDGGRLVFEY